MEKKHMCKHMASRVTLGVNVMEDEQASQVAQRADTALSHPL